MASEGSATSTGGSPGRRGASSWGIDRDTIRLASARTSCTEQLWPVPRFAARDSPPSSSRLSARRAEEHTSELQSLMRISYAVFCLKKKKRITTTLTEKVSHQQPTTCDVRENTPSNAIQLL